MHSIYCFLICDRQGKDWIAVFTLLVVLLGCPSCGGQLVWTSSPSGVVFFSNSTGAALHCEARDLQMDNDAPAPAPAVTWLLADGQPVVDMPGIREVLANGSLVFPPFPPRRWSAQAHSATYRCRASTSTSTSSSSSRERGSILSTPVTVQAVLDSHWSVTVRVIAGGTLLRCEGEGEGETSDEHEQWEHVLVVGWFQGEHALGAGDEEASVSADGRVLALWGHRGGHFRCEAQHQLTGQRRSSRIVTVAEADAETGGPPRVLHGAAVSVRPGDAARLLCVAAGARPVRYGWSGPPGAPPVALPPGPTGLLVLSGARASHSGRWRCTATNAYGTAGADVSLVVSSPLAVTVRPKLHVADAGNAVTFTCSVRGGDGSSRGASAGVRWLHDGQPLGGAGGQPSVSVRAGRDTQGHYQCEVLAPAGSSSDSAELRLGESPPELVYTFIEQAVLAGAAVSLSCRAVGSPLPTVAWLLDNQPIGHMDAPHRSVSQWSPLPSVVESRLNVSLARPVDGGRYACRATNGRGSTEHAARLNVYGPPAVRSVPPLRVVSGANVTIHCPYSGFPISEIRWQREGIDLPRSGRVSVSPEGSLRLQPAESADGGLYSCHIRAPHSHYAQNDLQIVVKIPPKISGFFFPTDLVEGSSVQVLCGITSGDKPVYFSWLKDGHPISPSLQVKEKSQDEFSFLIFSHLTSKHSGEYTCIVTNSAAEVTHTATLAVKVAPSWDLEPQDSSALLASEVVLHCATKGHPKPIVLWLKEQVSAGDDFRPVMDLDLRSVTLDNGTLVIPFVENYHEGRYKCRASNGIGRGLTKTITVTVNEPARVESSTRNVTVKSGAPVSLSCDARGDQPLALRWTRDSGRLDLTTFRVTVSERRSPSGAHSVLSVTAAARGDGGAYRCRAENTFGRDEVVVFVTVQEYPSAVVGLAVVWRGSRGVRLRWQVGGSSAASPRGVTGYRVQQRALPSPPLPPSPGDWLHTPHVQLPADSLTLIQHPTKADSALVEYHLESLKPGTSYAVRVAAVNEVGVSPYCRPAVLRTLEEVPSEPPRNVEVQAVVPGELSVKWKAPPQESWNGELLGYTVTWRAVGQQAGEERVASVRGWAGARVAVAPLLARSHARYELRVRAFNGEGLGPSAAPVTAAALDAAPSVAPGAVRCAAIAQQSLRVWWEPIERGAVTGYDVIFEEADSTEAVSQWRRAVSPEVSLSGLRRGANYSIAVRAQGGPTGAPVYCATPEDVPGAPVDLRAVPDSETSVLLSWLPPVDTNGRIEHYTLYYRPQRSGAPVSLRLPAPSASGPGLHQPHATLRGLRPTPHDLWVTASTSAGEGDATTVVVCAPMHRAPAKIVSMERVISYAVGSLVTLPCVAAGAPPPLRQWSRRRQERPIADDDRFLIDGSQLIILKLDMDLSDNYTCVARNPWGSDHVTVSLVARVAPGPPQLRLLRATRGSLTLGWQLYHQHQHQHRHHVASVTGYIVEYSMMGSSTWRSLRMPSSALELQLSSLACGAMYRARVTALSALGPSLTSQEITVATDGGKSKVPQAEELLTANSTCVRVNVLAWDTDGCGVSGWGVAVRPVGGGGGDKLWTSRVLPAAEGGATVTLCALRPATWYQLKVTPHSEAKPAPALYHFSTLTVDGERIPKLSQFEGSEVAPPLAAVAAAGALLAAVALVAIVWRQRRCSCARPPAVLPAARKASDRPRSCQQLYSSAPAKPTAGDTHDLYEISPYATFSMPAPPLPLPLAPLAVSAKHRSPQNPEEYTLSRAVTLPVRECQLGSDSESSPDEQCRACSRPRFANDECLRAVTDSSTESADTRGEAGGERRRRRRGVARQPPRADHERRDFTIHV